MAKSTEDPDRYPTLSGDPKLKRKDGFEEHKYWQAEVKRTNGQKAKGIGDTRIDATDDAYQKAGGTVNRKAKYKF